jgi:hypothetical protein
MLSAVICLLLVLAAAAQVSEPVDNAAIEKIKAEAARASQALDIANVLTNTYGARLTNAPSTRAAGAYAQKKLLEWKLADVRLETWNFGYGWTNERFTMKLASDPGTSFLAAPKAWTQGTAAPVTAEVVEGVIRSDADFARLRGKLRGKIVLILPAPSVGTPPPVTEKRFTDADLLALAAGAPAGAPAPAAAPPPAAAAPPAVAIVPPAPAPAPVARAPQLSPAPSTGPASQTPPGAPPAEETAAAPEAEAGFFAWVENALSSAPARGAATAPAPATGGSTALTRARVTQFYFEEGVAAMVEPSPVRGGGLTAITDTGEVNPWKKDLKTTKAPPQIFLAVDQYVKLMELTQKSAPVMMELDIRNTYHGPDQNAFNVIADIKGSDKADEFVVIGAHLDSWHIGKGATDNAAGVAVVMEAMRILRATGLPMRRTVRLGLWTGEEQGLLGSRAFVDKYFINRPIYQTRPAHSKLSVYFNVDNGTGAIRGVYLQGHTALNAIFNAWMSPFRSLGMTTLATRLPGSSDQLTFDNAGLPGFQFIQDPIEYPTRTHHTNLDTFDRLIKDDLVRNATIVASFAYLAANRDEALPRKPLPRSIRPAGSAVP